MLSNIRIVLVNTSHPGNIGAAEWGMKPILLQQLHLVRPKHYTSAEATARSSGADDLLARGRVCAALLDDLGDALLDLLDAAGADATVGSRLDDQAPHPRHG